MTMPAQPVTLSPQEERIRRRRTADPQPDEASRSRAATHRRLDRFRDLPVRLSVERARLLTESLEQTEGRPPVWRWGKALAHVLAHIPIHLTEHDLIAGSAGPEGRYALLYPEVEGRFFQSRDNVRPSAAGAKLVVTEDDVQVIHEKLWPYWSRHQYHDAFLRALPEETRRLCRDGAFLITPTATARSALAWCHDYAKVLDRGLVDIRRRAERRLAALDPFDGTDELSRRPFLQAVILVCDAVVGYARRYAELAERLAAGEPDAARRAELLAIAAACRRVPEQPAESFFEAVQSQWLIQTVSRLEQRIGGSVGNGRIDQYLYPYYRRDIEGGRLTEDTALRLLEALWLGMARSVDVYALSGAISFTDGYAHWEATTIGGQTPGGRDATNELSHLILRSKREFPLSYPDLAARIHSRTPDSFLGDVCETIKEGTGFPKLLFDDEIIGLLLAKGAGVAEAHDYCAAGCTEVKMVNRDTIATGCAWVNLGAIVELALNDGRMLLLGDERLGPETGDPRAMKTFDEVWQAFCTQAEHIMRHTFLQQHVADTLKPHFIASPLCSMLHDLCLESCRDMHAGPIEGGLYLGFVDTLGFATAIDSLAAVKKLVFDDRKIAMGELLEALQHDFRDREVLRQKCLHAPKYGNGDPYADQIGRAIEQHFTSLAERHRTAFGGQLDIRYVSVTSHIPLGMVVSATPDGRRAHEPLSEGISPSQGADTKGPTASLASIAATRNGGSSHRAARLLNMKLSPAAVAGPEGTRKLMQLVRTANDLRLWHLQFNVINRDTLLAAKREPERYRDLLVRVAGYSAYFVDLLPQLQDEIIARTEHCF